MQAVSKLLLATLVLGTAYGDAGVRLGEDFAAEFRLLDDAEGLVSNSAQSDTTETTDPDLTVTEDEVLQLEEEYLHEYTT